VNSLGFGKERVSLDGRACESTATGIIGDPDPPSTSRASRTRATERHLERAVFQPIADRFEDG